MRPFETFIPFWSPYGGRNGTRGSCDDYKIGG